MWLKIYLTDRRDGVDSTLYRSGRCVLLSVGVCVWNNEVGFIVAVKKKLNCWFYEGNSLWHKPNEIVCIFLPRHSIVINIRIRIDLLSLLISFFFCSRKWWKFDQNLKCERFPLDNVSSVEHFNWFLFFPLFIYLLNWAEDGQFNEIKRNGSTFFAVVFF